MATAAFEDARFCSACHQFPEDGYALNGKLLENTYEEWKASRHAREGRTCQSCHMPERRHLWRGIHDPETMRRGVTIEAEAPVVNGGKVRAALRLINSGTGHYFPTYVTPKVVAEVYQEDARRRPLHGTSRRLLIGRQVTLDLTAEIADTRLPPDGSLALVYERRLHPRAVSLLFRVVVEPDAFYTGFYRSLLSGGKSREEVRLLREALATTLASRYTLYETREPLQTRR